MSKNESEASTTALSLPSPHTSIPSLETVTSSNTLIRSYYTKIDSVVFLRLFNVVAAQIKRDDEDFATYSIPFTSIFSKQDHGGNTYKFINKTIEQAMNVIINIPESNTRLAKYSLFGKCTLDTEKNLVEVSIHPDLKPYLLNLQSHFTQYQLEDFKKLSSTYSQRLFQLLSSWKGSTFWRVDIEKLHNMLDTSASMRKDFKQFRVYALEQAQKELLRGVHFYFRYEVEKLGRKVRFIIFYFEPEDEAKKQAKAKQEIEDLQKKSNKCFEGHMKKNQTCIPKKKSKTCGYCLSRGRRSTDQFRLWDEPGK